MKFKRVYIEITNVCNLNCNFCPKTKRKAKFMEISEFESVIEKIKDYTDYVYFHVLGEPLLHKNIFEFLKICEENNLKVNITTNGTLLKGMSDKLLESKALRQINISLHSFEANNGVDMEEYLQGVFEFIDNEKNNINTVLRLWNIGSVSSEKNDYIFKVLKNKFNLEIDLEEHITDSHGIKLKDGVFLQQAERFEWPDIKKEPYVEEGFCYALRSQIAILADGTVVPCCLDGEGNMALGNIHKQSFSEIMANERAKNIYNGFSKRQTKEKLCKTCGYINLKNEKMLK